MRQREGERASERHQNKINVGCMEACRFYEIWIVPGLRSRSIKSVGGPPLELDAGRVQHVRLKYWRLSCMMCCAHDMGPIIIVILSARLAMLDMPLRYYLSVLDVR